MGRAYYKFGQDVALRLASGDAFALREAELGAVFGVESAPVCLLRGTFSSSTYRALVARQVLAADPALHALAQPVKVRLELEPSLAATVAKDAVTLSHVGRRLAQNSMTDELARKLLTLEQWHFVSATPAEKANPVIPSPASVPPAVLDEEQEALLAKLVAGMANELWLVAEEAGEATQAPALENPIDLFEAVRLFFLDEGWEWEAVANAEGLFRTIYDGQHGSWMCYTRILQDLDQVLFYSACPVIVPTSALNRMMEYLCRVNSDLSLGNFELDFAHSAVRFRTSIDVTDVGLAPLLFRNLVYQNLAVMDLYLSEILAVIAGSEPLFAAA